MKKISAGFLALILVSGLAFAGNFAVEVRGQYFNPVDQDFKNIYGGGMMFGGKAIISVWKGLAVWVGADYFTKKGETTFTKEETTLRIIPVGIGLRYSRPLSPIFRIYGGLGLQYHSYSEKSELGDVSEGGIGILGEAGGIVNIVGGLFMDIFIDYSYCKFKPADFRINIGGLSAGVGLGIQF